jgi:two-component system, LuxR family, sensor kinase FixL
MDQRGKIALGGQWPQAGLPQRDQSEAVLAADYKFSPVAQVTLDGNGCIRRANVAAAVLLKGELSRLTKIPFLAFVDKAYCRTFLDHIAQATSGTKKICTRLGLSSATRAVGPVELQSTSRIDTISGNVFCRTAIVTFSSPRRIATNGPGSDQYACEEWLELFPDAALLEFGGKIISANHAGLSLLATKSPEQIQGRDIFYILHSDCHESFRDRVTRLPKGKSESAGIEETFIRLDGEEIVVNVLLKSINFDGVFATLLLARDLSPVREMQENLAQAKDLCTQILANNSIATGIISVETGRFIETNKVFCRLVTRPREEIIGQPLSTIQLLGTNGELIDFFSSASERDGDECEAQLTRQDGSVHEVLVSAKTILSGHERCLLLMIQDPTDLWRLRKDIVAISEEEQRRFSRDLHDSHCQDLTAIAFFGETIAAGLGDRDDETAGQIRMLVGMVQKSAENVHALAAGLDSQQIQEIGLIAALDDLAVRIGRRFGLACTARLDQTLGEFDSSQAINLFRIAQEAMSNAARHSEARTIVLRLRRDGPTGLLEVQDDGAGFAAETHVKGLGLRTMQYRASIIKGTLTVDSRPGAGTTITCSFPAAANREG